jgi:hypothetical protein
MQPQSPRCIDLNRPPVLVKLRIVWVADKNDACSIFLCVAQGAKPELVAELRFDIPAMYVFHKETSKDVAVRETLHAWTCPVCSVRHFLLCSPLPRGSHSLGNAPGRSICLDLWREERPLAQLLSVHTLRQRKRSRQFETV